MVACVMLYFYVLQVVFFLQDGCIFNNWYSFTRQILSDATLYEGPQAK